MIWISVIAIGVGIFLVGRENSRQLERIEKLERRVNTLLAEKRWRA